jgi:hypothetical protein
MARGGSQRALLVVGTSAVAAGLVGLGIVAYWYGTDMGWTGTGSLLVEGQAQARATALVPALAVLVGAVAILTRRHVPGRSPAGVLLLVTTAACVVGAVLAVSAYPHGRSAELYSHRVGGWTTTLPITEVSGVSAESADRITLVGRADRRGCDWRTRAVTVDPASGRILEVEDLPRAFDSPSDIPPEPEPVDPARFEVRHGSVPFICRS